jgi:serine/threonine-protein kinase PRP4
MYHEKVQTVLIEDFEETEQRSICEARLRREKLKTRVYSKQNFSTFSKPGLTMRSDEIIFDKETVSLQYFNSFGCLNAHICNLSNISTDHINEINNKSIENEFKIIEANLDSKHDRNMVTNPNVEVDIFAYISPEPRESYTSQTIARENELTYEKSQTQDTYDDPEGYYKFTVAEIIDQRYKVLSAHGRGVFSTVLRARELQHSTRNRVDLEVAVKVIRANETMKFASHLERIILNKLSLTDPTNKRHIIMLFRHFEYRNHVCLVFEPMSMNLRTCIKRFGRKIGLNIQAVRTYTIQMLIGLKHLKNNGILHADIKPDNILIDDSRTKIKICDFGSAMLIGDIKVTPYLVSRFYRPPEVILGLTYNTSMDLWSIGCVIYELSEGQILFCGKTNNEMIKRIMDVKGSLPKKVLRKGAFSERHFDLSDPSTPFYNLESQVSKYEKKISFDSSIIKNPFYQLLSVTERNKTKVVQLADLLERIMALDPEKRITASQALKHPFCNKK